MLLINHEGLSGQGQQLFFLTYGCISYFCRLDIESCFERVMELMSFLNSTKFRKS